jgi:hypothetical protein
VPHKIWSVGEEVLAADLNNYVQEQTVPRFPNASTRTSQLGSPELNMLSLLDTRPGVVQYWSGGAWVDVLPFIQSGLNTLTPDGNGLFTIAFPTAFAAPPVVVGTTAGFLAPPPPTPGAPGPIFLGIVDPTTVGSFQGKVFRSDGLPLATPVVISWMAIGSRP